MTDHSDQELTIWIKKLRDGNEEAAERVWRACFEKMSALARKKLGPRGQRGADEEDIALSAMNSFVIRCRDGQFDEIQHREDLWKLLMTITVRKAYQHTRKQMAAKRSGELGEEAIRQGEEASGSMTLGLDGFADARAITPDQLVQQLEQEDAMNQVIDGLEEALRKVAIGRLSGMTNAELAEQLNCSTRTIERKLQLIRKTWQDALD